MAKISNPADRKRLRAIKSGLEGTRSAFDPDLAMNALAWALATNKKRDIPKSELFSDPFVLISALIDLTGADAATLYAAILYPSVRPEKGTHFNPTYLDEIVEIFKGEDGVVSEEYATVRDLVINALQIRALDLLPPPSLLADIESAFQLPEEREARNLAAYFILTQQTVKDQRAWAIRAAQWYLRLVDMRENPKDYTDQERINAYYYTDKFYSPFCEYLAMQKLKEDKSYNPQDENKGLYRLKTAMDEELMRQINPEAYDEIRSYMYGFVRSFGIDRGHRIGRENTKLIDLVMQDVQDALQSILHDQAVPQDFVRVEARWKKERSIYQKIRAGRKDIHDYFGVRIIVNIDAIEGMDKASTNLDRKKIRGCPR